MPIYIFRGAVHLPARGRLRLLTEFNKTAWSIEIHWQTGKSVADPLGAGHVARYRVLGLLAIQPREPRFLSLEDARRKVDAAAKRDFAAAFEEADG